MKNTLQFLRHLPIQIEIRWYDITSKFRREMIECKLEGSYKDTFIVEDKSSLSDVEYVRSEFEYFLNGFAQ